MITKEFIKALKQADTVCIHYRDNQSYIRAIKRATDGVFTSNGDMEARLDVNTRETVYQGEAMTEAFCYISSAQYNPSWMTIVSLLRAGDILTVEWIGNNNHELDNENGLAHDQTMLIIQRGKRVLTFNVDDWHGPKNSSARMVKTRTPLKVAS